MITISKKLTTNAHLIKDVLTQYSSTFIALKELITNSLQAGAKKIQIHLAKSDNADSFFGEAIGSIIIEDNGHGVSFSEFDETILEIGTENKQGGMGVGRFGALQIGRIMEIETVAYDKQLEKFTKTSFRIDVDSFNSNKLNEEEFFVNYEIIDKEVNSYYRVTINSLYHNESNCKKQNKLTEDFLCTNFKQRVFENYPFEIFEGQIHFYLNDEIIKKDDFIIDEPKSLPVPYKDTHGGDHKLHFTFYNVNHPKKDISLYLQVNNAGINTSIAKYSYASKWYTSDLGTWFIFLNSDIITRDIHANFSLSELGEKESKGLIDCIKDTVDNFFESRNTKYKTFIERLVIDKTYPYKSGGEVAKSRLQETIFKKTAYILEEEHKLLEKADGVREVIYPLLNQVIEDGNTQYILEKVVSLSDESRKQLHDLLEKTELEDVIRFSSSVVKKLHFLDFLHELTYGEISKVLLERKQLHKIIEKHLWLFDECYNGMPHLWSDTKLANNLDQLHHKFLNYQPTLEDENLIEEYKKTINDITDIFFYNERKLGNGRREVIIVELKAPSCSISLKEINQVQRYAFDIESMDVFAKDKVSYKIILISSKISGIAKSQLTSARKNEDPFLYEHKTKDGEDIKTYIMSWSELISYNRQQLTYLSEILHVKDESADEIFNREYPELASEKTQARFIQKKLDD